MPEQPSLHVGHSDSRAAFLAGEGTLTAQEVREWAAELAPHRGLPPLPAGMPESERLMVSVVMPADHRGLGAVSLIRGVSHASA
jgi:hypothetical protein